MLFLAAQALCVETRHLSRETFSWPLCSLRATCSGASADVSSKFVPDEICRCDVDVMDAEADIGVADDLEGDAGDVLCQ